ncbi:putative 5' nucleotidase, deoxy (Pyrimidine), cytosolic type C protein (NT5C) [Azospirillaceae bacterium]
MIYLDMDGVIADFTTAYLKLIKSDLSHDDVKDWNIFKYTNQTESEFWVTLGLAGEDFWTDIPIYPYALNLIKDLKAIDDVTILTSVFEVVPVAAVGKIKWLEKYVKPMIPICIDSEKHKYAYHDTILIDDKPDNVRKFIDRGGKAFLFEQPWNEGTDLPVFEGL